MENKEIEVNCPCCSSRLSIDVRTRTVMRALSPQEQEDGDTSQRAAARWTSAKGRVEDRSDKALDRLDSALSEEQGKESRLDDLFDKASEKLKRRTEESGEREF